MAITVTYSRDTSGHRGGSTDRDELINYNKLVSDVANVLTFLRNSALGSAGLAINSNFDVKNGNAITVTVGGVQKSLSANTNFDTGTTANIAQDKWGIAIITWDGTTPTVTWAAASTAQSYATEAAAKAALGTGLLVPASGFAAIGYVTVQTGSGHTWTAGTDALTTGTGGNPATTTNYYNDPTLNGTYGIPANPTAAQIGNMSGSVITS